MTERNEEFIVGERLGLLAEQELPEEDALTIERRRRQVVSGMGSFATQTRKRQAHRSTMFAGVTLALSAAAALALWLNTGRTDAGPGVGSEAVELALNVEGTRAEVTHAAGVTELQGGKAADYIRVEQISTPHGGSARVKVPQGVPKAGLTIELSPETELHLPRPSATWGLELVHLKRGTIDLSVPKLAKGTSFSIVTPSIRVSVIGTAFSIEVKPGQEHDSCVRVSEGVVQVSPLDQPHPESVRLGAGQAWGCAPSTTEAEQSTSQQDETTSHPPTRAQEAATRPRLPQEVSPSPLEAPDAQPPASTLAAEAALLAQALRAEQRRNYSLAKRDAERLIKQYPNSPVVLEARKLLSRMQLVQGTQKIEPVKPSTAP